MRRAGWSCPASRMCRCQLALCTRIRARKPKCLSARACTHGALIVHKPAVKAFHVAFNAGVNQWSILALLRFLLALIVAVNHLADYAELGVLAWLPHFGALEAILGFLLVSGYSIGASYEKSPTGFYWRRAWRVYPIYVAAMLLTFVASPAELTPAFLTVLLLNLLFLNQVLTATSYVGPAWSLSLEIWLYALTPLLSRLSRSQILVLVCASIAVFTINTCGRTLFNWVYFAWQGYGLNLLTLSFPWLLGFLLARSSAFDNRTLRWVVWVLAYHLALAVAIQFGYRMKHEALDAFWSVDVLEFFCRSLTLILVFLSLTYAVRTRHLKSGASRWMNFLGDLSYPLYLTHIPVAILCTQIGVNDAGAMLFVMLATSATLYFLLDSYSRSQEKRRLKRSEA